MSFEKLKLSELKSIAENFGVDITDIKSKSGIIDAMENEGVTYEMYDTFANAEKAEVEVCFIGEESRLKPESLHNFKRLEENHSIQFIALEYVDFDDYDYIIDAILGTGKEGELKPIIQSTIKAINESKAFKVSVDVPSGMDPDTGRVDDIAVNADLIVTFHARIVQRCQAIRL